MLLRRNQVTGSHGRHLRPTAKLRRLVLKKYRLLAMKARLEAEMSSSETIETPAAFSGAHAIRKSKAILERQRAELWARRASLATEESLLVKQIAGLEESIRGYQAQVQSTKERIALFAEELKDKNSLLGQQLVRKSDVLAPRRSEASPGRPRRVSRPHRRSRRSGSLRRTKE